MANTTDFFENMYAQEVKQRKKSMADQHQTSYSNRVINHFVECIDQMNQVVLIPSKLIDIEVPNDGLSGENSGCLIPPGTDLFQYYQMLNSVRNDIYSGSYTDAEQNEINKNNKAKHQLSRKNSEENNHALINGVSHSQNGHSVNGHSINVHSNGHANHVSSQSSLSSLSSSSSSSESGEDTASQLTNAVMQHLHSLYSILHQLALTSQLIANKYQEEVEGRKSD